MNLQIAPNVFTLPPPRIVQRSVTIDRDTLAVMAEYYRIRVAARPIADRGTIALYAAVHGLKRSPDFFHICHRGRPETGTFRQQAMAFARVISELDGHPTSFPKIGRAFKAGHTLVFHAYQTYGDSMRKELEAVRGY